MSTVTEAFQGKRLVLKDHDDGIVLAAVDPRTHAAEATMVALQLAADHARTLGAMDARGGTRRTFAITPGESLLLVRDSGGTVLGTSWVCGVGDLSQRQADKVLGIVERAYEIGRGRASESPA